MYAGFTMKYMPPYWLMMDLPLSSAGVSASSEMRGSDMIFGIHFPQYIDIFNINESSL